jgi:hypothetical protein
MLTLKLKKLPDTLRGIYGPNKDKLGERMLYAHPDLYKSIMDLEAAGVRLVFSDIFRSAKESLAAKRAKPGLVMPAGYSAHNFGLAVDLDVNAIMRELKLDKKRLDELLASFGLFCHRTDHKMLAECWHYNAFGDDPKKWKGLFQTSTARAIEQKIVSIYGEQFKMSHDEVIAALKSLRYFDTGDTPRNAIARFQTHWDLSVDGIAGPKTQRLLSYLTNTTEII